MLRLMPRVDLTEWATIAAELGDNVRHAREQRQITQEQLAHAAGLHRNQIQNIENSRNNARDDEGRPAPGPGNPRLDTLWAIAVALDITVEELLPHRLRSASEHQ